MAYTKDAPVPIDVLRDVINWAGWQSEDYWCPPSGPNPTIAQIVQAYTLCHSRGVETLADLATHPDPAARTEWKAWLSDRGE